MNPIFYVIFILAVLTRLASVAISKRHERALRARGAVEHGAITSRLIALAHTAFYLAAFVEGWVGHVPFDALSMAALVLFVFSFAMLAWIVVLLGPIWTVKVMILPDHVINRHVLFRLVRHPNYFLNILPELVAYGLIFHAFWTMVVGLPIYAVLLAIRIDQEEKAMRHLDRGPAQGA